MIKNDLKVHITPFPFIHAYIKCENKEKMTRSQDRCFLGIQWCKSGSEVVVLPLHMGPSYTEGLACENQSCAVFCTYGKNQ